MAIREIGILFRGFNLCHKAYDAVESDVDKDLRAGMFSAILSFCSEGFGGDVMDSLSFQKYSMIFTTTKITLKSTSQGGEEVILAYIIIDKEKGKGLTKKYKKRLAKILNEFLEDFPPNETSYSEISKFRPFEKKFDQYFVTTAGVENRIRDVIF